MGERLRALRRRRHLSLEQAEEETKVRLKYLEALEKGDYGRLPADVYTIGFLTKYAEFLGAPREELLLSYRRERQKSFVEIAPKLGLKERKVYLTPKVIIFAVVFLGLAALFSYVFYSVKNFTSAPNLEISSPVADQVLRQDKVEVIGKTDEGASLQINGQTVFLDERGNFHETIKLQPGLNNIEVRATNRLKKETIKIIKILAEY